MRVILLKRNRVLVLFLLAVLSLWLVMKILKTGVVTSDNYEYSRRTVEEEDATQSELEIYAVYDKSPHMRRTQPGYLGRGVRINSALKTEEEAGYKRHSFNQLASDKITLQRALPDYRNKK